MWAKFFGVVAVSDIVHVIMMLAITGLIRRVYLGRTYWNVILRGLVLVNTTTCGHLVR